MGCSCFAPFARGQRFNTGRGCAIAGYSTETGIEDTVMPKSGDDALDQALMGEFRQALTIFGVNPGLLYFDDNTPNAEAHEKSLIRGTSGTILIGINLVKTEMDLQKWGGIAVAGICAHECAHILQFYSDTDSDPDLYSRLKDKCDRSDILVELHADLLAGFYLQRTNRPFEYLDPFGESLFRKGDYKFNCEQHHGTPHQRIAAMREGYVRARVNKEKSLRQCAEESVQYVEGFAGEYCRRPPDSPCQG